jgi:hypothetical protein
LCQARRSCRTFSWNEASKGAARGQRPLNRIVPGRRARIAVGAIAACALVFSGLFAVRANGRREHRKRIAEVDAASCAPWGISMGPACGRCVAAYCCAQISACYSDVACVDINDCAVTCGEPGESPVDRAKCPAYCDAKHPAAKAAFHAWDDCARANCEAECPRRGDDDG